jgi:sugar phosphate isomerase/epimerase
LEEIAMHPISRRSMLASVAAAAGLRAAPLGLPIGCQTYPIRDLLAKDFDGTLKMLAGLGYRAIEMCSPPGYERSGYGPLVGIPAAEMKRRIQAAGLRCESCHYTFRELKENLEERIAFAKELGLKHMVLSSFGMPRDATLADWMRASDELNRIGERTLKAGLPMAFHNHNIEFSQLEGVLLYDKMLERLDAKLVRMQFQVAVISLGFEAATYFNRHPGRFVSIHLQDWDAAEKKTVAIGRGVVDWKALFGAAKKGGVENYFVEVNLELMKESIPFLQALRA